MYVCKGENSRAVAAGLVLAVRRPPDVQTMKKSIKTEQSKSALSSLYQHVKEHCQLRFRC